MRLKFLWLAIGGAMSVHLGWAQTDAEKALLFSRITQGGSARIQAMGGAQTALGGDASSAHSNPAGLGMYNRSEAIVSIGIQNTNLRNTYFDNTKSDSKANFNLPMMGMAFCSRQQNDSGFIGGTFAVTYNRVNSFSQDMKYSGANKYNSMIDRFIERAWGNSPSEVITWDNPTGLAYQTFLISDGRDSPNQPKPAKEYWSVLGTNPNDPTDIRKELQEEQALSSGKQGQVNFSYGANFNDRFYVGGGVGMALIDYNKTSTYTESNFVYDKESSFKPINYFTLSESAAFSGIGINATLGIIARPIDAIQVGLSYVTPTKYAIAETYTGTISANWNNYKYSDKPPRTLTGVSSAQTAPSEAANYALRTPSRLNAGITFFIKKAALITSDVQLVNYGGAKYSVTSENIDFAQSNSIIDNSLKRVVNLRFGGEYRLKSYRLRAGYSMMPDPFKEKEASINQVISAYSLGLGYRAQNFTIDAAAILTQNNNVYRPYPLDSNYSPFVASQRQNVSIVITASFPLFQ